MAVLKSSFYSEKSEEKLHIGILHDKRVLEKLGRVCRELPTESTPIHPQK